MTKPDTKQMQHIILLDLTRAAVMHAEHGAHEAAQLRLYIIEHLLVMKMLP